jgi:hypothetical protein
MAAINDSTHPTRPHSEWTINYTQSDVDTIREQIEQTESAKRHWLVLGFIIALAAFAGAIVLLSANYALYKSSVSENNRLIEENSTLKSRADQTQRQLDAKAAQEAKDAQAREEAQSRLDNLLPGVVTGRAGRGDIAAFARMVYHLPNSRVELSSSPPDGLFRNWKISTGSTTEVYTLVGGFVDGKWVVYSNLIARRSSGS